ncbi:MAG: restriction endonuclease subunit S [Chloroflexi bacterium]|nr:restriction endonuclease subunit S [Chloroflexota bacterium]
MKPDHLPEGWRLVEISELVEEYTERAGLDEYEVFSCSKIHGVILQKEKFKQRIASKDTERYKILHTGDFVYDPMLAWDGSIGRNQYVFSGVVSPAYVIFRSRSHRVDTDFLEAVLTSDEIVPYYRANSEGTNVRRRKLRFDAFGSIVIPLPPIDEQRRIAEVLCDADANIARVEVQVETAQEVKRGAMHRLFTYGLAGEGAPTQHTSIGEIPAGWEVKKFGTLITFAQNGLYKPESFYGRGTPIIRVDTYEGGQVIRDVPSKRIDVSNDELTSYRVYRGDFIMNRVNGSIDIVGKTALVGNLSEPVVYESNMIRFRLDQSQIYDGFALFLLSHNTLRNQIKNQAKRGYQMSVSQTDLNSFIAPLPSLEEQREIAAILGDHDAAIRDLRVEAARLREVKRGLMQKLLSGQVRV